MSIGSKIKALRRAKDLTQEDLAEVLGVTSKAISQWECNRTAPDISQLPVLCNFFEVTADELLEIDVFQKQTELDKICDEFMALSRNGKLEESLLILKEGLKRFPHNAHLMDLTINSSLSYVHTRNCSEEEKEQLYEECRRCSEHILEHSTEDLPRYTATNFLCGYYNRKGETEKAWEYALKLPSLCTGREFAFPDLNTGTDKAQADQHLKHTLLHFFVIRMLANYQLDSGEWLYNEDERMELRNKKFALFDILYEQGDYGFFGEHLAESHEMQARCFAGKQNKEKCLYHLEKAADCAIAFIEFMKSKSCLHTSLLWKGFDYPSKGVSVSERENVAEMILARTNCAEYDSLRKNENFVTILEKLSGYADENNYPYSV